MPGTGKTASVLQAMRRLHDERRSLKRPFIFAHINAMCLSAPGALFTEICRKVPAAPRMGVDESRPPSESQAHSLLSRYFAGGAGNAPGTSSGSGEVVVLLVDEIDCLVTQAQSVLYRLFDWLSLPGSRLVVVAIANTMDLPERLLPRVTSRLGVRRVNFAPYSRAQLRAILVERLRAYRAEKVFSEDALTLCSARIAASSGDARKALQVCRRAIEARMGGLRAEALRPAAGRDDEFEDGQGPVSVSELSAAEVGLLRGNPAAKAISGLSRKARRVLLAFVLELRQRPGNSSLPLSVVIRRYEGLAAMQERRASGGAVGANLADALPAAVETLRRHADDALFCMRRLQAIAVLHMRGIAEESDWGAPDAVRPRPGAAGGHEPCAELGDSLDVDDVADALAARPRRRPAARSELPGAAEEEEEGETDDELASELLGSSHAGSPAEAAAARDPQQTGAGGGAPQAEAPAARDPQQTGAGGGAPQVVADGKAGVEELQTCGAVLTSTGGGIGCGGA